MQQIKRIGNISQHIKRNVSLDISGYFHLDVLDFLVITAVNGFQFAENLSELKMLRGDGTVLCIELRVSSGYFDSIFRRNYKNAFWAKQCAQSI